MKFRKAKTLKQCAGLFSAAALAVCSATVLAQTSSSSNQAVAPSASSTVNTDARFKAMPHSNVTISPSATTNQSTSAAQTTGTAGITAEEQRRRGGTSGAGVSTSGVAGAASSAGGRTSAGAVAGGSVTANAGVQDRNTGSPGRGYAKGRN
jgi:hypothetical protein